MDIVVLAPQDFESILSEEVGARLIERRERLFLLNGKKAPAWAQNVWFNPERLSFESISEAARHLRSLQRSWALHSVANHRRAQLIQAQLPPIKSRPFEFGSPAPQAPMGGWTLWSANEMIYSPQCSSLFPNGTLEFQENKIEPPSRAYLKLWEFFTVAGRHPQSGQRVLDLGSSPGGWTWVLDQMNCDVVSVDKAPLDPKMKVSSRVRFLEESAFALEPEKIGRVDWLFSDVICYPERLLALVQKWSSFADNMVCTIKFQGATNHEIVRQFAAIPGAQVRHLFHNKHELTWSRLSHSSAISPGTGLESKL